MRDERMNTDISPCPMLVELVRVCERMLGHVRRQEIECVDPLAREAENLLHRIGALSQPLSAADQSQLDEARRLQQRIRLMLASQKQETARQLEEIASGRRALHAYGSEASG